MTDNIFMISDASYSDITKYTGPVDLLSSTIIIDADVHKQYFLSFE